MTIFVWAAELSLVLKSNGDTTLQDKYINITIALGGMIQAIDLIGDISQTGQLDEKAFRAMIYSIFETTPRDMASVYGNLSGIKPGIKKLLQLLDPGSKKSTFQMRYLVSLMHLQKKLSRSPHLLNTLSQRIQQIQKQAEYFSLTHPTVIANLADTYLTTIGRFKFRVIIWGNQLILTNSENMDKIRALLFSGVRSVVLWRQAGGSRLQLLFSRIKIKTAAEKILATIQQLEFRQQERETV